jgi:hypothetical protein
LALRQPAAIKESSKEKSPSGIGLVDFVRTYAACIVARGASEDVLSSRRPHA